MFEAALVVNAVNYVVDVVNCVVLPILLTAVALVMAVWPVAVTVVVV